MSIRVIPAIVTPTTVACLALAVFLAGCAANPQAAALTPIPSLAPGATAAPVAAASSQPTSPPTQPAVPTTASTAAPAGAAAAGGAASPQPAAQTAAPAAAQGDAQQGAAIFDQNCSPCHGKGAQGGAVGPKLAKNADLMSDGDPAIFATIANGRPGTAMPAWSQAKGGRLTDAQINDVIAYLHSIQ